MWPICLGGIGCASAAMAALGPARAPRQARVATSVFMELPLFGFRVKARRVDALQRWLISVDAVCLTDGHVGGDEALPPRHRLDEGQVLTGAMDRITACERARLWTAGRTRPAAACSYRPRAARA